MYVCIYVCIHIDPPKSRLQTCNLHRTGSRDGKRRGRDQKGWQVLLHHGAIALRHGDAWGLMPSRTAERLAMGSHQTTRNNY